MLHYSLVNRISPPFLMVHSGTVNGILSLIKYQNIKKKIFLLPQTSRTFFIPSQT